MTITKLRPTFTFDQDRLNALRVLAPEAFADGKVNWEALREALGDRVEDEGRDAEHFGLFWPGKRAARRLASMPSAGTLRPAPGEHAERGDAAAGAGRRGERGDDARFAQGTYQGH